MIEHIRFSVIMFIISTLSIFSGFYLGKKLYSVYVMYRQIRRMKKNVEMIEDMMKGDDKNA